MGRIQHLSECVIWHASVIQCTRSSHGVTLDSTSTIWHIRSCHPAHRAPHGSRNLVGGGVLKTLTAMALEFCSLGAKFTDL